MGSGPKSKVSNTGCYHADRTALALSTLDLTPLAPPGSELRAAGDPFEGFSEIAHGLRERLAVKH